MLYLTLRHYEYICAVAEYGSLSAAAEALHVSQPALSTALARAEDHLGHALFVRRQGAPLSLTPQGRDFAKAAQKLVEQARRLEAPDGAKSPWQELTIGSLCPGPRAALPAPDLSPTGREYANLRFLPTHSSAAPE